MREQAVRLVAESRHHRDSEWAAITSDAAKLGVGTAGTVRKWVRQAEIDVGAPLHRARRKHRLHERAHEPGVVASRPRTHTAGAAQVLIEEVVPGLVEVEAAVPRLSPAVR